MTIEQRRKVPPPRRVNIERRSNYADIMALMKDCGYFEDMPYLAYEGVQTRPNSYYTNDIILFNTGSSLIRMWPNDSFDSVGEDTLDDYFYYVFNLSNKKYVFNRLAYNFTEKQRAEIYALIHGPATEIDINDLEDFFDVATEAAMFQPKIGWTVTEAEPYEIDQYLTQYFDPEEWDAIPAKDELLMFKLSWVYHYENGDESEEPRIYYLVIFKLDEEPDFVTIHYLDGEMELIDFWDDTKAEAIFRLLKNKFKDVPFTDRQRAQIVVLAKGPMMEFDVDDDFDTIAFETLSAQFSEYKVIKDNTGFKDTMGIERQPLVLKRMTPTRDLYKYIYIWDVPGEDGEFFLNMTNDPSTFYYQEDMDGGDPMDVDEGIGWRGDGEYIYEVLTVEYDAITFDSPTLAVIKFYLKGAVSEFDINDADSITWV